MKHSNIIQSTLLYLGILLSNVSYGHTSYSKKITCPIDGETFKINVTGSYTTFGNLKDFQKQGAIGDLYESYINSCPKCHFSGYQSDFDSSYTDEAKLEILKILEPFKNSIITDVLEHEIAIKIYQYLNRGNDEIANLYLVASYIIKSENEDSMLKSKRVELQLNCVNYFIKAIEAQEYKEEKTLATIHYLIGELYRRTGNFEKAITYFDLALSNKMKADWLNDYATKQKELALKKDDNNSI